MFTGIIQKTSWVTKRKKIPGGLVLSVAKPKTWKVKVGDSVTVNGVCSTVKAYGSDMVFEYMPESLRKTSVGGLVMGDVVNLEQSMRASDRLDGHIVQGHVDTVGIVKNIITRGNSRVVTILLPQATAGQRRLLAPKGSVAVEGVSLTIVDVLPKGFTVHLIPYTWEHTNWSVKTSGAAVNVEFDALAKYVARLVMKK